MIEKIYFNSPVIVQNLLLSIYSYRRKKKFRKNTFYYEARETILEVEKKKKKLLEFQNRRVDEIIKHALQNIPFYKKKYAHLNKDKFDLNDLNSFSILTKKEVKDKWDLFQFWNIKNVFKSNTSGTSGSSLNLRISENCTGYERAEIDLYRSRLGYKERDKIASFIGRKIMKSSIVKPPFWRFNYTDNQLIFSNWHVSEKNLPHYVKKLNDFSPDYIHGYPSFLYLVAEHIKRNNMFVTSPRGIFTSSETLFDYQRNLIESVFKTKILDRYGSAEQLISITQCELGEYHVDAGLGVLEILENNVVVTTLHNYAMPLIRYSIGDRLSFKKGTCKCGRNTPLVFQPEGRIEDIIISPSGRKYGRLDHLFKEAKGIIECQIIQKSISRLVIKIVSENPKEFDEDAIKNLIISKLGSEFKIEISLVDFIERYQNGKYKFVISELNK